MIERRAVRVKSLEGSQGTITQDYTVAITKWQMRTRKQNMPGGDYSPYYEHQEIKSDLRSAREV